MKTRRERISVRTRNSLAVATRARRFGSSAKLSLSPWATNTSHHAHPFWQRHPANGRRCDAMPIKHQNDALLRQLYGITADVRWRRIDSLFVSSHLGRQSNPRPMHQGRCARRKRAASEKNEWWKGGRAEKDGYMGHRRKDAIDLSQNEAGGKWTIFQWIGRERDRERERERKRGPDRKMEFFRGKMEFWAHREPPRGVPAVIRASNTLRWFCGCFDTLESGTVVGYVRCGKQGDGEGVGRTVSYDFRLAPAIAAAPTALWMYAWDTNFMLYALNAPVIRSRARTADATPHFALASAEEKREDELSQFSV